MSEEAKEAPDPFKPEEKEDSVFQSTKKTLTFSNGYKNDGKDPSFKLLNTASLDSSSAISGIPPGVHQHVIRANSVHHYLQNVYNHIDQNDTLQVDGQQSVTIMQNTEHFYKANFLRGVSGNDHLRVNQQRDLIVLGESSEQYVGKHEVTAPEEFEWKSFERGFSFTKIDLMGIGLDAHGANVELYVGNVAAGIDTAEGSVFSQEIPIAHEKESAIMSRQGVELDILLRGDALIDIGTGTPFR